MCPVACESRRASAYSSYRRDRICAVGFVSQHSKVSAHESLQNGDALRLLVRASSRTSCAQSNLSYPSQRPKLHELGSMDGQLFGTDSVQSF